MAFVLQTFLDHVKKQNPTFERVKESSLHDLLKALEALKDKAPTKPQKEEIQRHFAFVPGDKQKKYSTALDYLSKELGPFVPAIPTKPVMKFTKFEIQKGGYPGLNAKKEKKFIMLDPDVKESPGPRGFVHRHQITWESSNGDVAALKNVRTREYVKFRTDTQAAPFNKIQDPDREFYAPGEQGTTGETTGTDDHSTKLPALVCCFPRKAGTLMAEQWYQYSLDNGKTWANIEGAAYLIEKTVKKDGNDWVYVFKKSNWTPHNTKKFHFEVHYTIADPPEYLPATDKDVASTGGTAAEIKKWARKVVATG